MTIPVESWEQIARAGHTKSSSENHLHNEALTLLAATSKTKEGAQYTKGPSAISHLDFSENIYGASENLGAARAPNPNWKELKHNISSKAEKAGRTALQAKIKTLATLIQNQTITNRPHHITAALKIRWLEYGSHLQA